jgi:hypothetical protein
MAVKPRPDHCCIQKDACPPPGFPCTCQENRALELSDLKKALEGTTMSKPEFVHPTYIRSTPERLWQGLTDPAFTSPKSLLETGEALPVG